jgi:hypothetical protein
MINEAAGLNKLGDPSVTLPLGTARADRQRLEDEVNVLNRNPGLQSSLTLQDLNEIEANLGYLQKKYRLSVNSMSVEGFQSDAASAGINTLKSNSFFGDSNVNYFTNTLTNAAAGYATSAAAAKKPATIAQLQDLIARIGDEIKKLTDSGSTDPALTRRVANLTTDLKYIQTLINKVTVAQTMKLSEIPITESVYFSFLSALDDINSVLPNIGSGTDSSSSSSGSSSGSSGRGSNFLSGLFADLSGLDISGISFDMNVRYTGRNEMKLADSLINTIGITKASASSPGEDDEAAKTGYRGAFDSIIKLLTGGSGTLNSVNTDTTGGDSTDSPTAAGSGPAGSFAWKERASFICDQIQKREMNPNDYGCLQDTTAVSENFSYRGYAKMICSRLATNYDPGIPELCGCPPPEWPGWRQ